MCPRPFTDLQSKIDMSLKLFLDVDLILLRMDVEHLAGFIMPQPTLGVSLTKSLPQLAEQLQTLLEKHFSVMRSKETLLDHDLGELQVVLNNQVWRFHCWGFGGSVRKGFLLEGIPLVGVRDDMRPLLLNEFNDVERCKQFSRLNSIAFLQLDARWHVTYTNPTLVKVYGRDVQQTNDLSWTEIIHEADRQEFLDQLFAHSKKGTPFQLETRIQSIWGQVFHVLVHCHPSFTANGLLQSVTLVMIELGNRPKMYQVGQISEAGDDPLTSLHNRRSFIDVLESSLRNLESELIALFYIDLDNFQKVNDLYGQPVGDQVLLQLSQRLSKTLRTTDTLARLGGDEFVLLVRELTDTAACDAIADKILQLLAEPYQLDNLEEQPYLSGSIGVRLFKSSELKDQPITSVLNAQKLAMRLIGEAEAAMNQAKLENSHSYYISTGERSNPDDTQLPLSAALHRAVTMNEFELYYQPQLNLTTGQLYGCECLIRWPGARWKTERFIQGLEDTHLMRRMGRWVLSKSIQQFADMVLQQDQQEEPLVLSVNISPIQFQDENFVGFIQECLEKRQLPASQLTIEITESLFADVTVNVSRRLQALKQLGVNIALDDFGLGYASLAYLNRFPIDIIKIDRSFIQEIDNAESSQMVQAMINLGKTLGRVVVAEGVETQQQLTILQSYHCDIMQGWLFTPVMSYEGLRYFYQNRQQHLQDFSDQLKEV